MIRKVSILEVKSEHLHIFSRFELPRIGATLLATILHNRGFDAEALFLSRTALLKRCIETDLAGISTITATAPASFAVADDLRRRGIPVVFGGPHASFQPEEALAHGDYCLVGEAEQTLPMLVEALNGERTLEEVPGLVWQRDGVVVRNAPARPIDDLDSLPFPDYSLLDNGRRRMGAFMLGGSIVPVQTSRGCPYDCSFCSVTGMFGKRYRFRSSANVIAELEKYKPNQHIFFYDDNFAANSRHTRELLQAMITRNFRFHWSTQVRADVARDPELLDLMVRAGCSTVFIGFESVDPRALAEMNKGQSVEEMRRAVHELRRRGVHVHGMFVFGFDADNPDTVHATVDFAIRERIDSAQFLLLTPLPGSELFKRLSAEGRLNDRDWDDYDAHHVTFRPTGFTAWKLQLAQIRAHARFYSWTRVVGRLLHGRLAGFIVGVYAHRLNRRWAWKERSYLKTLRRPVGIGRSQPVVG
jgi:radical SAM superfamily enzyme YgiQ (UPF0313 family)